MDKETIEEAIQLERYVAEKVDRIEWMLRKRKSAAVKKSLKKEKAILDEKLDKLTAIVMFRADAIIDLCYPVVEKARGLS